MSYAKGVILGNITRDIELKYTQGGTAVADVGIAVNRKRKQGEEWVDEVSFLDVTLWGKTAENAAQYLGKGEQVFMEVEISQERWEQDGQKRSKVKFTASRVEYISSKKDRQERPRTESPQTKDQQEDEIPF